MPLRVIERKDKPGQLQIVGKIPGYKRIRQAPQSKDRRLAEEEAAVLEARLLREQFHGKPERRGDRPFAEIAEAYLAFERRHPDQRQRVLDIVAALGDVATADVDQERVDKLRARLIHKPDPSPSTVRAAIITPLTAVLNFGWRRKWCDKPHFERPRLIPTTPLYFLPGEAERMLAAAAPHLGPLLVFLFGTGARLSETLALDWHEVDLAGAKATFLPEHTKASKRRVAHLPPAVVAALGALPHREGPVFRWETNPGKRGRGKRTEGYGRGEGRRATSQIKTAWYGAIRRAGLDTRLHPHCTRHSWASWHYAVHRDLLRLKTEGGWATVGQVECYAHLMPAGHDAAILAFWGYPRDTQVTQAPHENRQVTG
jgi:integrase